MSIPDRIQRIFGPVKELNAVHRVGAIATYIDDSVKVYIPKIPIEKTLPGMELRKDIKKLRQIQKEAQLNADDLERSVRRSRQKVIEYVRCNIWDWYVTFTFKADRYDYDKCRQKMQNWLDNQQDRKGKFKYIIVAELHKDGAMHFHALVFDYAGKVTPVNNPKNGKPLLKKGRQVYDMSSYTLGHVEAYKIEQTPLARRALGIYLSKYLTKEMTLFPGRKRYWISSGLNTPVKEDDPAPWFLDIQPVWKHEGEWGNTLYFNKADVDEAKKKYE